MMRAALEQGTPMEDGGPVSRWLCWLDEIAEVVDAIDRKIDLHRRKRGVLEELFKSLRHKLMTGEIRVADLDMSALPAPEPALQEARS